MKKFLVLFFLLTAISVNAQEVIQDTYERDILISKIDKVSAPYSEGDFVVFTAQNSARHVGIAFDFEGFRTIHSFQQLKKTDLDDEVTDTIYFYILEVPKNIKSVKYRLVIDGLWTVDPTNPVQVFDNVANLLLSQVDIQRQEIPATSVPKSNLVHFVYQGKPGLRIRLGGTFTNWDSSIYVLNETSPGFYELEIPLPKGTHYYAYYEGITSFIDTTNPERAYTVDGKSASAITVE